MIMFGKPKRKYDFILQSHVAASVFESCMLHSLAMFIVGDIHLLDTD